ncbi:pantoate--beta-alanine ligase [Sphingomonas sp. ABOLD]|uniref:Pantothenate synthetase n=1 Tax=Sphingomonas trueperi TaxID=53317 RepID=A0A7X6BC44_9SPHN|nr:MULTISPECIES: pantoate--beta-alanine ligase [unclassified Sphingomonas]NJB96242.1 pantoate--beta-alanine ligase [Sphingomonas trueperi]RSV44999.1 pantoate--beta-alanine ligase [Sphingomonas sp. ABOLE]RSV51192.1 pantoate--beta-alanine ligase [Sphingomonas sp. ABOLD]
MQTVRQIDDLRQALDAFRSEGARLAFVPTMGALHDGHMALVEAAKRAGNRVIVSIFVNPIQFGPNEDLAKYPRREQADSRLLANAGVDLLWMPTPEIMYPEGFATSVRVSGVSEPLDGAHRPGHFDGVATVVSKLFHQVQPHVALFGEKDWQQLQVIRRMVADLDMPIEIQGVPTQREDDGLALSSRNAYLMPEDRARAVALPRALGAAAKTIGEGGDRAAALAQAQDSLTAAGFEVDYVALVDAESLAAPIDGRPMRLLAAARIGGTRLIDNIPVL